MQNAIFTTSASLIDVPRQFYEINFDDNFQNTIQNVLPAHSERSIVQIN